MKPRCRKVAGWTPEVNHSGIVAVQVRLDSATSSLTDLTWQVGLTANKASLLGIEGDLRAAEAAAAAQ